MEAESNAGHSVEPEREIQVSAATRAGEAESKVRASCLVLGEVRLVERGGRLGVLKVNGKDMMKVDLPKSRAHND